MLPKCPHCQEPLTKKQVARLLASLSAGKPKNYTDEERTLRRERMRAINARRKGPGSNTAMQHRHLTHQDFTLAAIDDVIARGRRDAWESLQAAFGRDREIRAKVLRVCAAHVADPYAQRYHFWNNYAHLQGGMTGKRSAKPAPTAPPGFLQTSPRRLQNNPGQRLQMRHPFRTSPKKAGAGVSDQAESPPGAGSTVVGERNRHE